MKTCPKCESEAISVIGIDKTLIPQLIERSYIGIGDFFSDVQIMQCGNCGCRFINMNDEGGGFIKKIGTESSASKPKTFKLQLMSITSFKDTHGDERKDLVSKLLSDEVNLEDLEKESEPKKKSSRKKKS